MQPSPFIDISKWNETDFQGFIVENSPVFHAFARRYINDQAAIDDVLQDSFLKLWSNRGSIGRLDSPVSYFFSIIRNTILNNLRSRKNRELRLGAAGRDDIADEDFFIRSVIEAESSRLIADSIDKLSEQSRRVIIMTLQQKKMQEIADELGITVNTVKTVKYRALERLSKLLAREDFLLLLSGCCIMHF